MKLCAFNAANQGGFHTYCHQGATHTPACFSGARQTIEHREGGHLELEVGVLATGHLMVVDIRGRATQVRLKWSVQRPSLHDQPTQVTVYSCGIRQVCSISLSQAGQQPEDLMVCTSLSHERTQQSEMLCGRDLRSQQRRTCSQKMERRASDRGSMPVSRDVPCSAFTIAPIDGCDVHPAHADTQRH